VVVFGDADAAGETFARTLVAALLGAGVQAVAARPDSGDVTAWRESDPEGFATAFVRRVQEAIASQPKEVVARLDAFTDADLTDLGMAKRLRSRIEARGSGIKFAPEIGFYLLDGGVWRPDHLDFVRTEAQNSAEDLWREADEIEVLVDSLDPESWEGKRERKRLGRLRNFAKHANSSRGIDSMIREVQALRGVAADVNAFDSHPHLLAVRTGDLQPPDPALLLTRRVETDYVPAATAPRWARFLDEVFPTYPDLPPYVRRLVGYGITGSTEEQCFAVLWGTGANGKSVFTDTLTEVFREITTTTPFSTFEERGSGGIPNDLAALKGSRLVMAAEGEQGRPMAEAVLKRVTGRDLIAARFMRKEFFEFRPTFLLLLATNYKPQFRGQDEGLWRRVKLLPWSRYFADHERDHRLGADLLAEREGILAWAVRGSVEWHAGGLQDPEVVKASTKEYRETSDALAGFMGGDVLQAVGYLVTGDEKDVVTGRQLWDAYQTWTDEEALPMRERWTRKTFFAALEERGLQKRKRAEGIVFVGVRKTSVLDHRRAHGDEDDRADEEPLAPSSPVPQTPTAAPSLDAAFS
jgi:putative DNA primase/helicase